MAGLRRLMRATAPMYLRGASVRLSTGTAGSRGCKRSAATEPLAGAAGWESSGPYYAGRPEQHSRALGSPAQRDTLALPQRLEVPTPVLRGEVFHLGHTATIRLADRERSRGARVVRDGGSCGGSKPAWPAPREDPDRQEARGGRLHRCLRHPRPLPRAEMSLKTPAVCKVRPGRSYLSLREVVEREIGPAAPSGAPRLLLAACCPLAPLRRKRTNIKLSNRVTIYQSTAWAFVLCGGCGGAMCASAADWRLASAGGLTGLCWSAEQHEHHIGITAPQPGCHIATLHF